MATFGFPPSTILVNLLELGEMFVSPSVSKFSLSVVISVLRAFALPLPILDRLGVGPVGVFSPLPRLCLRFCLTGFDASLFFPLFDT